MMIMLLQRKGNVKLILIPVITGADWKHIKVTHIIPEQHTGKVRKQVTTENSHTGHYTLTAAGKKDTAVFRFIIAVVFCANYGGYVRQKHNCLSNVIY
jgi:hypothetical protein